MPRTRPTLADVGKPAHPECRCPVRFVDRRPHTCGLCGGVVTPDDIDRRIIRFEARRAVRIARAGLANPQPTTGRQSA